MNSEHFLSINKMCAYHKYVNFIYILYINILNEPQVTICTLFVVNFVFLSITFVRIALFLKIGGNNTQM